MFHSGHCDSHLGEIDGHSLHRVRGCLRHVGVIAGCRCHEMIPTYPCTTKLWLTAAAMVWLSVHGALATSHQEDSPIFFEVSDMRLPLLQLLNALECLLIVAIQLVLFFLQLYLFRLQLSLTFDIRVVNPPDSKLDGHSFPSENLDVVTLVDQLHKLIDHLNLELFEELLDNWWLARWVLKLLMLSRWVYLELELFLACGQYELELLIEHEVQIFNVDSSAWCCHLWIHSINDVILLSWLLYLQSISLALRCLLNRVEKLIGTIVQWVEELDLGLLLLFFNWLEHAPLDRGRALPFRSVHDLREFQVNFRARRVIWSPLQVFKLIISWLHVDLAHLQSDLL